MFFRLSVRFWRYDKVISSFLRLRQYHKLISRLCQTSYDYNFKNYNWKEVVDGMTRECILQKLNDAKGDIRPQCYQLMASVMVKKSTSPITKENVGTFFGNNKIKTVCTSSKAI